MNFTGQAPVPSVGAIPVKFAPLVFCEELNGTGGTGGAGRAGG